MLRLFIVFAMVVVVFHSFMNPINRKYNEKNLNRDILELTAQLDSASVDLILLTINEKSAKNISLKNFTYRDLLEEGKAWEVRKDSLQKDR